MVGTRWRKATQITIAIFVFLAHAGCDTPWLIFFSKFQRVRNGIFGSATVLFAQSKGEVNLVRQWIVRVGHVPEHD
jgi:hypothetical protein